MIDKIYIYLSNQTIVSALPDRLLSQKGVVILDSSSLPALDKIYNRENDLIVSDIDLFQGTDIGVGDYHGNAPYVLEDITGMTPSYCRRVYARKHHIPAAILETPRFIVREMALSDLNDLYELYDTLSDCPYVEKLYSRSEEERFTQNYIEHMYRFFEYGLWLVYSKADGKLVARIGIENREIDGRCERELGYLVGRPYQRQHVAYEVCLAVIEYARSALGIDRLFSCIHKTNLPSMALAEKLNFSIYAKDIDGIHVYYQDL